MVAPAPPIEAGAAELPGVPRRRGAGRPQRARTTSASSRPPAPQHGYRWPDPRVLDTAALARRVLTRDEVPNRKLGTLAGYFRTTTQPTHRALDDARATVDVLHGADRPAGQPPGPHARRRRSSSPRRSRPAQRRKRHLADGLPDAPGVYVFRAADGRPLYVGTSDDDRHPGAQLLHRRGEARADLRDDRTRPSGSRRSSAPTRWRPRSASCG